MDLVSIDEVRILHVSIALCMCECKSMNYLAFEKCMTIEEFLLLFLIHHHHSFSFGSFEMKIFDGIKYLNIKKRIFIC